ncbi:MAG: amidase family protein [Saprospiraceae bacterium]
MTLRNFTCIFLLCFILVNLSGQERPTATASEIPYLYNKDHPISRMRFKVLSSKVRDNSMLTHSFSDEIKKFGGKKYILLKPLILELDIPTLQQLIKNGKLTYTDLVMFYIYRIHLYESNPDSALNAIISLNPEALNQAKICDREKRKNKKRHPIYGMPILLKDNIGFSGIPTTAGAEVLMSNTANDAFIVKKMKEKGAIILGKTNLSEWAYYFCNGCPVGYSAVGGQSLNPYGKMIFETGGSSSGSGIAVAANYAVAAVGTETSGSILSPSSMNSVTGLKPTVGLLSRSGIVPISSTLDTPGPMTKNVTDNAILLDAMTGYDGSDQASDINSGKIIYQKKLTKLPMKGKRIGIFKNLMELPNYARISDILKEQGAIVIEMDSKSPDLPGFRSILSIDMKYDLPSYLATYASDNIKVKDIKDIIAYNNQNIAVRAPYGQGLFEGIYTDTTSDVSIKTIKNDLEKIAKSFFNDMIKKDNLDIILSVNNMHAGIAAAAKFPCLTLPMGYKETGEPQGITLILPSGNEDHLYPLAFTIESITHFRKIPEKYN